MTGDLETRLRRYGETFEQVVDALPGTLPGTADELAVRRRVTRRAPLFVAIAACLVVALVIGGLLLVAHNDSPSVHTPAVPPTPGAASGCAGKAYVSRRHTRVDRRRVTATRWRGQPGGDEANKSSSQRVTVARCRDRHGTRRRPSGRKGPAICPASPDGKHV